MKQILFLILSSILFTFSISAQKKPINKSVKTPAQKITEQQATTNDGKPVTLKSDGTWQFSIIETSQIPQISKDKPCEMTLQDSPKIRGLKLGMTKEEVNAFLREQKTFENSQEFAPISDYTPHGILLNTYYEYALKPYLGFRGIDTLELGFFNDELHLIEVEYAKSEAQFTKEQFKLKISESLNLPTNGWTGLMLKCTEFEVYIVSGDMLLLKNLVTTKRIEESEQKKRDTFKP